MKRIFKRIFRLLTKVNVPFDKVQEERKVLDTRLHDITKATINGEEKWFLQLVKKDPDCAVNILRECNHDSKSSK